MNAQLDAFSVLIDASYPPRPSVPFQRGSVTSREGAEIVRPRVMNHEREVFEAIVAAGANGITRKELAAAIRWADNQQNRITGRVASLMQARKVREKQDLTRDKSGAPIFTTIRRDGSAVLISTGIR